MVFESRVGETFLLGATTWRIEEITHDRVLVSPAPGEPGKMPFWKAEGPDVRSSWAAGSVASRASCANYRPRPPSIASSATTAWTVALQRT